MGGRGKKNIETFDGDLDGKVHDATEAERPATPAEMARGRARKKKAAAKKAPAKKAAAKKAPAKKAPPKKKQADALTVSTAPVPGDVPEEALPKVDMNVSLGSLRERKAAIERAMKEMEEKRSGNAAPIGGRREDAPPPTVQPKPRRTRAEKAAIRARATALVDQRRAEERQRIEREQLIAAQRAAEPEQGKRPATMNDKAVEGLRAGATTLDVKDAATIKRMEVAADKNIHGKAAGRAVLRSLMQKGPGHIDTVIKTNNLADLSPGEVTRLIEWLLKNAHPDELKWRSKGAETVTPEVQEKKDLPDEQIVQQQREKRKSSPGVITSAQLKAAMRATKIRPISHVKRTPLSALPKKVSSREAPADPRISNDPTAQALTATHGDPTATAAMRRATRSSGRGGKGSKARRDAERAHLREAYEAAKKRKGGGGIKKSLRRIISPKKVGGIKGATSRKKTQSLLRSARARQYKESLHRRDMKGQFADKPGAGNDAPKKPKQPPAAAELKDQLKGSRGSLERLAQKAPAKKPAAKKPAPKKAAPKKVQPRAFDDFQSMLDDRGDRDLFDEVMGAVESGKVKSVRRYDPQTLSKTLLIEDKKGQQFFLKRTAFNPDADPGSTAGNTQGDVVDDYLVSGMLNDLGVPSQRPIGFAADPNDVTKTAIVMSNPAQDVGAEMEPAIDDPEEFAQQEWADRREFLTLMVMDFLTNNQDRHSNNWFEYEDDDGRHVMAIDHSLVGGSAARSRGQQLKEVDRAIALGADDMPEDVIDAESRRTFYGYLATGAVDSDGAATSTNHNLNMAARTAALYDGDEEAFYGDLMEVLEKMDSEDVVTKMETTISELGLTGESENEALALLDTIEGRRAEIIRQLDDNALWETVQAAGAAWSDEGQAEDLSAELNEYLNESMVALDVDLNEYL